MTPFLPPPCFPPSWASGWGEDACGLWLTFGLSGIRQRFRWIGPGRFLMGAPAEENKGCFIAGKETLHEVTLSKGFWLADTAVTQELWLAVMKSNPSGFIGLRRPAERVSWLDAQRFLHRLNTLLPGLNARLPTEAEWECACRAGTETPFFFGQVITPEQVNCNLGGTLYRRRTVDAGSLPANACGLCEMHGNVWEWCLDGWADDLGQSTTLDPLTPEQGSLRAVRGGSWACGLAQVRSACRDRYPADWNGGSIGFRLLAAT